MSIAEASKNSSKASVEQVTQSQEIKNEFPVEIDASNKEIKRIIAPYLKRQPKKISIEKPEEKIVGVKRYDYKYKSEELFADRKAFLSDFIDLPSVMWQSAEVLKLVTNSTDITLYMVDEARNELYLVPKAIFSERHKVNWKIQINTTVSAYVAFKKEYVLLEDILNDDRFPNGLGYNDGMVKSVLAVPILTPEGDCFGVIEMHKNIFSNNYTQEDLKVSILIASWMGTAIHQNRERVAMQKQKKINECLLDLIKCFFTSDLPLAKMIEEIMKLAKAAIKSEKGMFFVIDPNSDDLLADMFEDSIDDEGMYKKNNKIKLTKDKGIAGLVARQKITIKLNDMYKDSRNNREIDEKTGFITKCVMSTPILSGDDVIGVVQMVNKSEPYEHFTKNDEDLFKIFSVYSALALHFDKLRQSVTKNVNLNKCYTDIILRHIGPCSHDIDWLYDNLDIPMPEDIDKYHLQITNQEYLPQYLIYMFKKIIGSEYLHSSKLIEFILTVKKVQKKNYYHNFEHAFTVTHCMYHILSKNDIFTKIEQIGLMVASLTHDIQHQGVTNSFLDLSKNNLSFLYKKLPTQNNNHKITMMILDRCQLFKNINEENYKLLSTEIKNNILATHTSALFKCKAGLQDKNIWTLDLNNETQKSLLKTLVMFSSEISCLTKTFVEAKHCLTNLRKELYEQGDLERKLGYFPLPFLDKEHDSLRSHYNLGFQNIIVLPCFDMLKTFLPNTNVMYSDALKLREALAEILEMKGVKHWRPFESIVTEGN